MDCRGNIAINQYDLKFNESGVRSWTIGTAETSGALTLKAGDEVGKIILNTGRVTVKKSSNSEVTPLIDVGEAETIAVDFDDADNFSLTIDSDSGFVTTRILGNPSNLTAGQSGCIVITQDASEVGDLTYASNWHFEGGTAPELTQTVGAADTLVYYCPTAAIVQAVLLKDIKAAT